MKQVQNQPIGRDGKGPEASGRKTVSRWIKATALLLALILALLVGGLTVLSLKPITVPEEWLSLVRQQIERVGGTSEVDLGDVVISLNPVTRRPRIEIEFVRLMGSHDQDDVELADVAADLELLPLLNGRIRPVNISAESMVLRMNREGLYDFTSSDETDGADGEQEAGRKLTYLQELREITSSGALADLGEISIDNLEVEISPGTPKALRMFDGELNLRKSDAGWTVNLTSNLGTDSEKLADMSAVMAVDNDFSDFENRFEFQVPDLSSALGLKGDAQVAGHVDSRASGAFSLQLDSEGRITTVDLDSRVDGTLAGISGETTQTTSLEVSGQFKVDGLEFAIENAKFLSGFTDASIDGSLFLNGLGVGEQTTVDGNLHFSDVRLGGESTFAPPLLGLTGQVDFSFLTGPGDLEVAQLQLSDGDRFKIVATARSESAGDERRLLLSARSDRIGHAELIRYWPTQLVPKTRAWLSRNLMAGHFHDVTADFELASGHDPVGQVTFLFEEIQFTYLGELPPISAAQGHGTLSLTELSISMEAGRVAVGDTGDVILDGSWLYIPEISNARKPIDISLEISGDIHPVLEVLDYAPFEFLEKSGIPPDIAEGRAIGTVQLSFPLIERITYSDVDINVSGNFTSVTTDRFFQNKLFVANVLNVEVNNDQIDVFGDSVLGDLPMSVHWTKEFGPNEGIESIVTGKLNLSDAFWKEFDIVLLAGLLTGEDVADFYVIFTADLQPYFGLSSDITNIRVSLPYLGWQKPVGVKGEFIVEGRFSRPVDIRRLSISAAGLTAIGVAKMKNDGHLDYAIFNQFSVEDQYSGPIQLYGNSAGEVSKISMGGTLDFRNTGFGAGGQASPIDLERAIEFDAKSAIISSRIVLTDIVGKIGGDEGALGTFTANVNGGPQLSGSVFSNANGYALRITAKDMGEIARATGIANNFRGGSLILDLLPNDEPGTFSAQLTISDTVTRSLPVLGSLLSYLSVVGLVDQLNGDGIRFSQIFADFELSPSGLQISEAYAIGASLGITATGELDYETSHLSIDGSVTPLYLFNAIAKSLLPLEELLGMGEGEGLGAVSYEIRGPVDGFSLTVNPITAITPGFLKKLFLSEQPNAGSN